MRAGCVLEVVVAEVGGGVLEGALPNPPTGFGPKAATAASSGGRPVRFVQRVPVWGASSLETGRAGCRIAFGHRARKPARKERRLKREREKLNHERPARAYR